MCVKIKSGLCHQCSVSLKGMKLNVYCASALLSLHRRPYIFWSGVCHQCSISLTSIKGIMSICLCFCLYNVSHQCPKAQAFLCHRHARLWLWYVLSLPSYVVQWQCMLRVGLAHRKGAILVRVSGLDRILCDQGRSDHHFWLWLVGADTHLRLWRGLGSLVGVLVDSCRFPSFG